MTRVTVFNNEWFTRMINAQLDKHDDASPDALAVARAIMVAGAFVAEALEEIRQSRTADTAGAAELRPAC